MLTQYRCTIRSFLHNGLRNPGDIVICDSEDVEMKGNQCFVPVEQAETEHIEAKKEKTATSPKQQPKKGTTK